ncbi:hypothetical protein GCM10010495_61010 [Kitasatospora herbaricolor]|uniref:hypothetical protein n=1 Tax=Kitasatospora herbaricolor TaxID=68217 RepID=UPI00174E1CBA|nr:hypothetical protein [Kitasatospora herbaricolor]MDQ0312871.1 hypothetical protein [Kitasatospora herbaricolor]GGV35810.1 hypothetical protein GCM10010495_61010 [Kitasatospora herbaricolor]
MRAPGTGPAPPRIHRTAVRWAALILFFLLGVVELLWGPGGLAGASQAAQRPGPSSVEELARRIGCTAEITTDAADLRQGMCTSAGEEIWIASFPTARAQEAWTSEAQAYGGSYLVGDGWVVVLSDTTADVLHGLLGGVVVGGAGHVGTHLPDGG